MRNVPAYVRGMRNKVRVKAAFDDFLAALAFLRTCDTGICFRTSDGAELAIRTKAKGYRTK